MLDSSGRRAIIANGTILDLMPVGRVIWLTGALLVALFTLVKPEASNGLSTPARVLFWSVHVGLGLIAIWIASRCLANRNLLPGATIPAILISGCGGIVIGAFGYLALDHIYAPYIVEIDPDPPAGPLPIRLMVEVLELAPWFMATWFLINLPVLLPRPALNVTLNDSVDPVSPDVASRLKKKPIANRSGDDAAQENKNVHVETQARNQKFLLSLPGVIGTDVIAVSSDLHYLNVWTVAGRTTVLGNLRDVIPELGEIGMQVHRSHWVAHSHVRRVLGTANNANCILSNELRIPISRRRWKTVREQYGRGVVHTD